MIDSASFVKSTPLRAFIGSFQHFIDIYFSKYVCISVLGVCVWGGGGSSKLYLLPSFILVLEHRYQPYSNQVLLELFRPCRMNRRLSIYFTRLHVSKTRAWSVLS